MNEHGTFYCVGVGPGDPSLLTLGSVSILERCPVIAAPRTSGGRMTALEIVRQAVDLAGKEILPLDFAMSPKPDLRKRDRQAAALPILDRLAKGKDVAMVNLGDVSLYASAGYLLEPVRQAGFETKLIPGVTSCSAAAAALGEMLAEGEVPLLIIPGLSGDWRKALSLTGTKVFMKVGKRLPDLYDFLRETDRLAASALVLNCGMEGERLIAPFAALPQEAGYFSLAIVKE